MEPTSPSDKTRPQYPRSQTAFANLSPTSAKGANTSSKKLNHLLHHHHGHVYHNKHTRSDEKVSDNQSSSLLHQVNPLAEIGRIAGKGSGHKTKPSATVEVDRQDLAASHDGATSNINPNVNVRSDNLEREKERSALRKEELQLSLSSLSNFAHSTTRRLDLLFYTILEKAGTLHDTIRSLQELSATSSNLRKDFERDLQALEREIQPQIDSFGEFQDQQSKIDNLELRIKASRDRAEALDKRLETSRSRLELWEEKEKTWQEKTSRRIRAGWSCLLVVLLIIVVLSALRGTILSAKKRPEDISSQRIRLSTDEINKMFFNKTSHDDEFRASQTSSALPVKDTRLDIFDEL